MQENRRGQCYERQPLQAKEKKLKIVETAHGTQCFFKLNPWDSFHLKKVIWPELNISSLPWVLGSPTCSSSLRVANCSFELGSIFERNVLWITLNYLIGSIRLSHHSYLSLRLVTRWQLIGNSCANVSYLLQLPS